jgi:hypothetical protein
MAQAPPEAEEPFILPPLGASDATVRRLVEGLSSYPQLAAWLVPDDLVRRFVEAVVDISRGSSPLPAMEVLIPEQPFLVQPSGDQLMTDPRSQRRYDALTEVFASMDPDGAARVYSRLLPLFEEAYRELGVPDGPFPEVLDRAIDNLLAVQVPQGPLELRVAVGRFVYADRDIEALTPAAKHLVRMGSENAARVQEELRKIQASIHALAEEEGMGPGEGVGAEEGMGADTLPAGDSVRGGDTTSVGDSAGAGDAVGPGEP